MRAIAAFSGGMHRAARAPRLAVVLWLVNLSLAAAAAAPFHARLSAAIDLAPAADPLRDGLRVSLLADLLAHDRIGFGALRSLVGVLVLLALLVNALTTGGVLELLLTADDRPFLHRFGRGAGRFFGRFLRAGLLAGLVIVVVAGLGNGALSVLARRLEDSSWEPMGLVLFVARAALTFATVVTVLLALDFTRLRLVREDGRQVARAFLGSLAFVLRHLAPATGLWLLNAAALAAVVAAYLGLAQAQRTDTWPGIALMVAGQQAVMLARAGLRVALFGSEIALVGERTGQTAISAPAAAPPDAMPDLPSPS
jgi:hypothetical protein